MAHGSPKALGEVANRLEIALEAALLADEVEPAKLLDLSREVEQLTIASVRGEDLDGDGVVGSSTSEYGLEQLRALLQTTLDSESPPYHPLGRYHLFGLVKLAERSVGVSLQSDRWLGYRWR